MMFSYTITIYESTGSSVLKIDSLSETLKIDEALDSAVLTIPRSTRKENYGRFAPLHIVVSDGTNSIDRWYVTYETRSELESFGSTPRYTHTLALIEPTKLLEKYIVGSLTFTQPLGGSRYSLKDVVNRILNVTPMVRYSILSSSRVLTLDTTLGNFLDNIEAPQLYLDKKNMREAFIETFKYVNAIPRLTYDGTNWVLNADFINNRNINIEVGNGIMDYLNEADGEDYARKIEIFHENTIPTEDIETPSVFTNSITDFISFRNNAVVLGESDFRLLLTHDVYELLSFKAYMNNGSVIEETSLDDYIFEKKVYDTLDFDGGQGTKAYSVYWQYATNEIQGFSETFNSFSSTMAIENIISEFTTSTDYEDIVFKVEYIAYSQEDRSEQYREDISDFDLASSMKDEYTSLLINPSERINSIFQLTNNAYGQIQRLGVNTISFALKHKTLASYNGSNNGIYSQGDYTDDGYFITKVEIVYFTTYVIARYEMSKNFNRIAQFVSINKEFRPYEITLTKSDYTLKRDIVLPFQVVEISSSYNASHISTDLVTRFMNTFRVGTRNNVISGATLRYGYSSGTIQTNGVYLPLDIKAEKNTLKFKMNFNDTKVAGKRVQFETAFSVSLQKQVPVFYTDDYGILPFAQIDLFDSIWDFANTNIVHASGSVITTQATLRSVANRFPYINYDVNIVLEIGINGVSETTAYTYVDDNNVYANYSSFPSVGVDGENYLDLELKKLYYYSTAAGDYQFYGNVILRLASAVYQLPIYYLFKDQSEVLGLDMTLPFIVNRYQVNKFIVGNYLAKDNCLVKERSSSKTLYFYGSNTRYTKAETEKISTSNRLTAVTVGTNSITVPSATYSNYDSYAIADYDGNLYLAVNQRDLDGTKTEVPTVYFNFLYQRSE